MKICAVTGARFQSGNNVSHAVNKTRRRFNANIQKKRLFSVELGSCSLSITPRGVKFIEKVGGLDAFLGGRREVFGEALELRRRLLNKRSVSINNSSFDK